MQSERQSLSCDALCTTAPLQSRIERPEVTECSHRVFNGLRIVCGAYLNRPRGSQHAENVKDLVRLAMHHRSNPMA